MSLGNIYLDSKSKINITDDFISIVSSYQEQFSNVIERISLSSSLSNRFDLEMAVKDLENLSRNYLDINRVEYAKLLLKSSTANKEFYYEAQSSLSFLEHQGREIKKLILSFKNNPSLLTDERTLKMISIMDRSVREHTSHLKVIDNNIKIDSMSRVILLELYKKANTLEKSLDPLAAVTENLRIIEEYKNDLNKFLKKDLNQEQKSKINQMKLLFSKLSLCLTEMRQMVLHKDLRSFESSASKYRQSLENSVVNLVLTLETAKNETYKDNTLVLFSSEKDKTSDNFYSFMKNLSLYFKEKGVDLDEKIGSFSSLDSLRIVTDKGVYLEFSKKEKRFELILSDKYNLGSNHCIEASDLAKALVISATDKSLSYKGAMTLFINDNPVYHNLNGTIIYDKLGLSYEPNMSLEQTTERIYVEDKTDNQEVKDEKQEKRNKSFIDFALSSLDKTQKLFGEFIGARKKEVKNVSSETRVYDLYQLSGEIIREKVLNIPHRDKEVKSMKDYYLTYGECCLYHIAANYFGLTAAIRNSEAKMKAFKEEMYKKYGNETLYMDYGNFRSKNIALSPVELINAKLMIGMYVDQVSRYTPIQDHLKTLLNGQMLELASDAKLLPPPELVQKRTQEYQNAQNALKVLPDRVQQPVQSKNKKEVSALSR